MVVWPSATSAKAAIKKSGEFHHGVTEARRKEDVGAATKGTKGTKTEVGPRKTRKARKKPLNPGAVV